MPNVNSGRFLVLDVPQLVREMQTRVIEFIYIRWDGQQDTVRCTLSDAYIKGRPGFNEADRENRARFLNDQLNEGQEPKAVIHCWNVEQSRWMSLPTWTVLTCNYMNW